jgi:hypothetical protein
MDSLPEYDVLDAILFKYTYNKASFELVNRDNFASFAL